MKSEFSTVNCTEINYKKKECVLVANKFEVSFN